MYKEYKEVCDILDQKLNLKETNPPSNKKEEI